MSASLPGAPDSCAFPKPAPGAAPARGRVAGADGFDEDAMEVIALPAVPSRQGEASRPAAPAPPLDLDPVAARKKETRYVTFPAEGTVPEPSPDDVFEAGGMMVGRKGTREVHEAPEPLKPLAAPKAGAGAAAPPSGLSFRQLWMAAEAEYSRETAQLRHELARLRARGPVEGKGIASART